MIHSLLPTEADIREKIIGPWLRQIGIDSTQILLEHSFSIRLGHNERVLGRADYLVKAESGNNLFVIEAKAAHHPLTKDDRNQAISYARLVTQGNIPPFAVVTNGHTTQIFDVLTKEELSSGTAFALNAHIGNNFFISPDLKAQAEALSYLLALTKENLLPFCLGQVAYRMRFIRSDNIHSSKKYIPQLYIDRQPVQEDLVKKLSEPPHHPVILVCGPPQVGKTSFLCKVIDALIHAGKPCLFYPAIGLKLGLLAAIEEDFGWTLGTDKRAFHLINKLNTLLKVTGQSLIIFIDALNEIDLVNARLIAQECERLASKHITLVVSSINSALDTILFENDSPTYLAEEIQITQAQTQKLKRHNRLLDHQSGNVIQLSRFSKDEVTKAAQLYSRAFNVQLANGEHPLLSEPFYMRVAMELYANSVLPEFLDTTKLLASIIEQKLRRSGLDMHQAQLLIKCICEGIWHYDAPLDLFNQPKVQPNQLIKLYESAILAELYSQSGNVTVDFYYSRERDFAIAIWYKQWHVCLLGNQKKVKKAFASALKTRAGDQAMRWFLSSEPYIEHLQHCYSLLKDWEPANDILINALVSQKFNEPNDLIWLDQVLQDMSDEQLIGCNKTVLEKLAALLYARLKPLCEKLDAESFSTAPPMLSCLFQKLIFLDAQQQGDLSADLASDYPDVLSEELATLLFEYDENIASLAASLLASANVELFLETIHQYIQIDPKAFIEKRERFEDAVECMDNDFSRNDLYCSVDYHSWEIEEQVSYYQDMQQSYGELLRHYRYLQTATYIIRTVADIRQCILAKFDPEKSYPDEVLRAIQEMGGEVNRSFDPNQQEIDFNMAG